ncbi:hypothetical protein ACIOHS_20155 [Streptomyces sp. NPDC088253]|uniref:hypothetical protein n=1 Tax=Streptomyces sp. NPDC088253 TaxID=3365846 RepID=UPI0038006FB1
MDPRPIDIDIGINIDINASIDPNYPIDLLGAAALDVASDRPPTLDRHARVDPLPADLPPSDQRQQ